VKESAQPDQEPYRNVLYLDGACSREWLIKRIPEEDFAPRLSFEQQTEKHEKALQQGMTETLLPNRNNFDIDIDM
jgi:hypothetical protein